MMKNSLIWSNYSYLIVGLVGIKFVGVFVLPTLLLFVCSGLHHNNESNKLFVKLDQRAAGGVIACNFYLFFSSYSEWRSVVGALVAFASLYRYYAKGKSNHAIRHVLTALATLILYYAYHIAH